MRTSTKTPNLFNIISKNAYATPSLLQSDNNSNDLKKCYIMTKTYRLCLGIKLNGLTKFKLLW